MFKNAIFVVLVASFGAFGISSVGYADEKSETLERKKWWPSEHGADDQIGAANRLTPQKVLEAASLIRKGEVVDLGRVVEYDMPLFELTPHGRKHVQVTISGDGGGTTYGPMG